MTGPSPVVLAVDGTGMLVRCAQAASRADRHLSAVDGTPTGALMMFISSLAKKLRLLRPGFVVIAWDGPGAKEWRREIYPDYKINRPPHHGRGSEMLLAREFCEAAGIRSLAVPGFEADDLLAAACRHLPLGATMVLCSDDNDMLQLLGGQVVLIGLGGEAMITAGEVEASWGAHPSLLPRVRALAGDPSDGIPGLPGIGRVRAVQMIARACGQWPLPEEVLPDRMSRRLVSEWRDVMDLLHPPRQPEQAEGLESDYFALDERAEWHREVSDSLRDFFRKYELSSLSKRASEGRLW